MIIAEVSFFEKALVLSFMYMMMVNSAMSPYSDLARSLGRWSEAHAGVFCNEAPVVFDNFYEKQVSSKWLMTINNGNINEHQETFKSLINRQEHNYPKEMLSTTCWASLSLAFSPQTFFVSFIISYFHCLVKTETRDRMKMSNSTKKHWFVKNRIKNFKGSVYVFFYIKKPT